MTTGNRNPIHGQLHDDIDDEFEDLLTLREVAQILRVPEATLRYWRHCNTGPSSFKIGRHIRYQRRDIRGWLNQQRRNGSPDAA